MKMQPIDNCVVTAQYEWTYVSRDYFTVLGSGTSSPGERIRDGSGPVGGDGFHTASENGYSNKIKLDIGSRYRITIDDGHMCLPADRSYTTIDDGYCVVFYTYTDTAMTQGANVRITDAISGNVMSAFGSASNYLISHNLHNGTIDYDSWPQSSMWNGSFHYCSEGNAYIRSGGGEEDYPPVGGAKLIFETETLSQDIYLKLLLSPTSGVYANARWTVEKIS